MHLITLCAIHLGRILFDGLTCSKYLIFISRYILNNIYIIHIIMFNIPILKKSYKYI